MVKTKHLPVFCLLLLAGTTSDAQNKTFHFRRSIQHVPAEDWYSLRLPADIFKSIKRDFADVRIYRLHDKDTVEIPYLLKAREDKITEEAVNLPVLNKSKKDGKLFLTFELKNGQQVNFIDLEFKERNFNGFVQLEGSQDQKEWFSIDSLQRILAIHQLHTDTLKTDFKATTLYFPLTNYPYLRVQIQADQPLTFLSASFKKREIRYDAHPQVSSQWTASTDRKTKTTTINVLLDHFQPVGRVSIAADNVKMFYRPVRIEFLLDSVHTPKGWAYRYHEVFAGDIASINHDDYTFQFVVTRKLQIRIFNADNPPLHFKTVAISGPPIELIAKLSPGENYIFYGNSSLASPSYDVVHFEKTIPASLSSIALGQEENIRPPEQRLSPFLESKYWLWTVIGIAILTLGYFTLKMMKSNA